MSLYNISRLLYLFSSVLLKSLNERELISSAFSCTIPLNVSSLRIPTTLVTVHFFLSFAAGIIMACNKKKKKTDEMWISANYNFDLQIIFF